MFISLGISFVYTCLEHVWIYGNAAQQKTKKSLKNNQLIKILPSLSFKKKKQIYIYIYIVFNCYYSFILNYVLVSFYLTYILST